MGLRREEKYSRSQCRSSRSVGGERKRNKVRVYADQTSLIFIHFKYFSIRAATFPMDK